jgi:hypothetical protein
MLVAVRAEFLEFYPRRRIATIFGGRVAVDTGRSLIDICATLGAFQRNNDANAFSHFPNLKTLFESTVFYYYMDMCILK